jgi:hypothetical protein
MSLSKCLTKGATLRPRSRTRLSRADLDLHAISWLHFMARSRKDLYDARKQVTKGATVRSISWRSSRRSSAIAASPTLASSHQLTKGTDAHDFSVLHSGRRRISSRKAPSTVLRRCGRAFVRANLAVQSLKAPKRMNLSFMRHSSA